MTGSTAPRHSIDVFGTDDAPPTTHRLMAGPLSFEAGQGALGRVTFDGVEVVRGIDMPIRDADWATASRTVTSESAETDPDSADYHCAFAAGDFDGTLRVTARARGDAAELTADLHLTAKRETCVNRAGFILLHPLDGVAGASVQVTHADGSSETLTFPELISPGQPAFDIAGMSYSVHGVGVTLTFDGEVFEMEDQRNWTDASFKTYCRPLGAPRPFIVAAGDTIHQTVHLSCTRRAPRSAGGDVPAATGRMPGVDCAMEPALSDAPLPAALAHICFDAVQLRLQASAAFPPALPSATERSLEIILPVEAGADALAATARAAKAAGFVPNRVIVLPEPYLGSIQPEGPWPDGPTPEDAAVMARAAFPNAQIGGGVLTNFTEFNRCSPAFDSDFVTFGTTAIVHDAGDRAVLETLEALPAVFASARALAGDRPVRLGLASIGMRSNPYGAGVVPNPQGVRIEMAMDDPRQRGLFAAAFAVGYAACAVRGGIVSFAPAMAAGALGLTHGAEVVPLFHVVRALATLAGRDATVLGAVPGGLVTVTATGPGLSGLSANLSDTTQTLDAGPVRRLGAADILAARDPLWLDDAPLSDGPVTLAPYDIAFHDGVTQ